jgi:hypothetical protein
MTFRSPSGVLAQPLQRQAAHSGALAALAAALKRIRGRGSVRLTTSPVSATWLSDFKRQSKRYRDY